MRQSDPHRAGGSPTGVWRRSTITVVAYSAGMLAVFFALYLCRLYSYLLFHGLVELFTVVVTAGVFTVAWNSRKVLRNNYLLFVGIAFLFLSLITVLHTLAYKGMGVFPGHGPDLPTQLWVIGQYMLAVTLVAAPFFIGRRLRIGVEMAAYSVVTTLLLLVLFQFDAFPACFVEGSGLTAFKIISEYVICGLYLVSMLLLYRKREEFEKSVLWMIIGAIGLTVLSELAFTLYTDPYGTANFAGHILRLAAFFLFYKAVIETGYSRPVAILFRDLDRRSEELRLANEELEGYARTVSHDLRTPLASIAMANSLIKDTLPGLSGEAAEEIAESAASIDRSLNQSYKLITDLLSLARAGQQPVETGPVEVSGLLDRIVAERDREIRERGAEVRLDEDLGVVLANETQLYLVFSNLVGNALRHNPGPSPVVDVRYLGRDSSGRHRYTVCDNGPGIDPELMDELFVPFATGRGGGTGVGLATVARIVKAYGGGIGACYRDGACFEFELGDLDAGGQSGEVPGAGGAP